jgi:NOL1/NOP2/fmu family ribosome biogenesis protein
MRAATPEEEDIVVGFFEGMEEGLWGRVARRHRLAVAERDGVPFAVLVTPALLELPADLLAGADAGGLPVGTLQDGEFHLDLQGAVLLSPHTQAQTVRITEHAARLFLYGRNVLGTSIERHDPSLEKGDACVVANPRGEALGIGVVVGSMKGPREAVKPVADLGMYLREQTD